MPCKSEPEDYMSNEERAELNSKRRSQSELNIRLLNEVIALFKNNDKLSKHSFILKCQSKIDEVASKQNKGYDFRTLIDISMPVLCKFGNEFILKSNEYNKYFRSNCSLELLQWITNHEIEDNKRKQNCISQLKTVAEKYGFSITKLELKN